jgi:hypothetical protein
MSSKVETQREREGGKDKGVREREREDCWVGVAPTLASSRKRASLLLPGWSWTRYFEKRVEQSRRLRTRGWLSGDASGRRQWDFRAGLPTKSQGEGLLTGYATVGTEACWATRRTKR